MKKHLYYVAALTVLFAMLLSTVSCTMWGKCKHTDKNGDGECDRCGEAWDNGEQSTSEHISDEQSTSNGSTDDQSTSEQTSEEQSTSEQTSEEQSTSEQTSEEQTGDPTKEYTVVELLTKAQALFSVTGTALGDAALGVISSIANVTELNVNPKNSQVRVKLFTKTDDDVPQFGPTLDNLEGYLLMAAVSGFIENGDGDGGYGAIIAKFMQVDAAYVAGGGTGRVTVGNVYYEKTADGKGYVIGTPVTKGDVGDTLDKETIIAYAEHSVTVSGNSVIFSTTPVYKDVAEGYADVLNNLVTYENTVITVDDNKVQRTSQEGRFAIVKTETDLFVEAYFSEFNADMAMMSAGYDESIYEQWLQYVDAQRNLDPFSVPDEPYIVCRLTLDGKSGEVKCLRNYSHDAGGPDGNGNALYYRGYPLPKSWLEEFDPQTALDLSLLEGNWLQFKKIYTCSFNYERQNIDGDGKDEIPPIDTLTWPTDSDVVPFGITYLPEPERFGEILYKTLEDVTTYPSLALLGINRRFIIAVRSDMNIDEISSYASVLYGMGFALNDSLENAEFSQLINRGEDYFGFKGYMSAPNSVYYIDIYGTGGSMISISLNYVDTTPKPNQVHTEIDNNGNGECDICFSNMSGETTTALPSDSAWQAVLAIDETEILDYMRANESKLAFALVHNKQLVSGIEIDFNDMQESDFTTVCELFYNAGFKYYLDYTDNAYGELKEVSDISELLEYDSSSTHFFARRSKNGRYYSIQITLFDDGELSIFGGEDYFVLSEVASLSEIPEEVKALLQLEAFDLESTDLALAARKIMYSSHLVCIELAIPEDKTAEQYIAELSEAFMANGVAQDTEWGGSAAFGGRYGDVEKLPINDQEFYRMVLIEAGQESLMLSFGTNFIL